jgi:acylphosphatase
MSKAVHLRITGVVQGVGFRYWTTRAALSRGLRGWVRNRHDGSVEALVIGDEEAVEAMIEACRKGPSGSAVDDIAASPATDDGSHGFRQRSTE